MLKNRLIPILFLRNGNLVRSEAFSMYQILGNPVAQVERYNEWDVDELIYIDITKHYNLTGCYDEQSASDINSSSDKSIDHIISTVASKCMMPLTFGRY